MQQLQELSLDIELYEATSGREQSWCTYREWERVLDMLVQLPCLQQIDFHIHVYVRGIGPIQLYASATWKHVSDEEISIAMREWLIQHDQTNFILAHSPCGDKRQDLGTLFRALEFAYQVVVAKHRNIYDQGSLAPPDFIDG